ncbi:amidohydrolase family protein, partial [Mycobacterium tuberculosis]|nr:amidohydrolase family protein [Mycobacterium tuberculosis]
HTRTVDADGALLTPGFVDAHVHTTFGGLESLGCDLSGTHGADEVRAVVADHLAATADRGEASANWLVGGGWSMADFAGGVPTADLLDDLSAD